MKLNIRKIIKKRVQQRIAEYCYHELTEVVKMKNAHGVFNYQCYENACQYASKHKGYKVVMGFYRRRSSANTHLHFWCKKDGVSYEVSIGYQCVEYRYYEIRIIDECDWKIIDDVFTDGLDYYKDKFTNLFERIVLLWKRIV